MKILLTGLPKSGKTTLLTKLLASVADKRGMIAKEVRQNDERIGFDLEDNAGKTAPLARTNKPTSHQVGRYYVDVEVLDSFAVTLSDFQSSQLLYIDEIGQMQLYSQRFKKLVSTYLAASNHYVGTVTSVYNDSFVEDVKSKADILLCEVTPDNREQLEPGLSSVIENRELISALPSQTQILLLDLAKKYVQAAQYIQLKKLFKNAVPYLAHNKIKQVDDGFVVKGDTNDHRVIVTQDGRMSCDCPLFNGTGQFEGKAGECSHIQAAKLIG